MREPWSTSPHQADRRSHHAYRGPSPRQSQSHWKDRSILSVWGREIIYFSMIVICVPRDMFLKDADGRFLLSKGEHPTPYIDEVMVLHVFGKGPLQRPFYTNFQTSDLKISRFWFFTTWALNFINSTWVGSWNPQEAGAVRVLGQN